MLQPTNRLTLIEAMRPPAGHRFESAMAVTYTLDLQALLAMPAALALAPTSGSAGASVGGDALEPIELIHALKTHSGKLTVFSQHGEIALPPSRAAFAFLERVVVPVSAPRGGIVHPKVCVLRYEAADEPSDGRSREQRLRVLITSRNLTFDSSWDTVVRLDETEASQGVTLEPVGELFEGLLRIADSNAGGVSPNHRERVASLRGALRSARFALPERVDDLRMHVLGLTEAPSPLPLDAERSLIISPFVSDDFFTRAHGAPVTEFVSRPESLDRLKPASRERVNKIHAFDDGSATEVDAEDDAQPPLGPGRRLVGLHAKVFAFEADGRARLFLGSANATGAAFRSNVEVLVEMSGPVTALGIDRLCGGANGEASDREVGLRGFFCAYQPHEPDDETENESALEGVRRAIARLNINGVVEESGTDWAVTYTTTEAMHAPSDIEIHCWPLTPAGHRREVTKGKTLDVRFETSLENLSGFLAFEVVAQEGAVSRFVVPVPLTGVPERRDSLLLRFLIGNAERFLRYLMAFLDEDVGEISLIDAVGHLDFETPSDGTTKVSLPVLEKLLRTMRRDPAKLAGLDPLVSDLADGDALPRGFAGIWKTIMDVAASEASAR